MPKLLGRTLCPGFEPEISQIYRRGNSEFLSIVHDLVSFMSSFLNFEVNWSDEEIEDELRIFFRCAVARDSWSAAGLSSVLHNATYQQTNAMDCIFVVCGNESSDTIGRVAMLLWCIWQNRNDKLWNDNVQMPCQIGRHAFDAWNDWYSVHKLQSNNVSGTTEADLVWWEKPALDWVKCNVDVAFVSGSGRTSMGLCFRDNSGHFMAGMTQWQQTVISSVEGEA
ncbi:hypothetical protein TSUD_126920 [Trifolium subterraneum]|nr:hypothetical protein TSUD_126920 [Trifolium subterraneum]